MIKKIRAALVWIKEGLQAQAMFSTGGFLLGAAYPPQSVFDSLRAHIETTHQKEAEYLYTDQFTAV